MKEMEITKYIIKGLVRIAGEYEKVEGDGWYAKTLKKKAEAIESGNEKQEIDAIQAILDERKKCPDLEKCGILSDEFIRTIQTLARYHMEARMRGQKPPRPVDIQTLIDEEMVESDTSGKWEACLRTARNALKHEEQTIVPYAMYERFDKDNERLRAFLSSKVDHKIEIRVVPFKIKAVSRTKDQYLGHSPWLVEEEMPAVVVRKM